jgi:two-component system NtrC family sensor kinase
MPDGGRLTIAARNVGEAEAGAAGLAGEFVAVSLADTGSGIPREVLARVFEPFFTTKEVGRGTGLGLSQVYGFATQSGGTVTISSEPGRGTTLTLYLPRSLEEAQATPPSDSRALRRDGQGVVLLVEDNPEVAEITRANLAELGYEVLYAADAAAALAEVRANASIDLVLSDIVMPGDMNGLDLARKVRTLRPPLPVLLATGYSDVAQEAADEGFAILRKPYEVATLHAVIAARLGDRRLKVVA